MFLKQIIYFITPHLSFLSLSLSLSKKNGDNETLRPNKNLPSNNTNPEKVKKSKKSKLPTSSSYTSATGSGLNNNGISKNKLSLQQAVVKDMMRQLLEEDKYSQKGSIVHTDSSDDDDDERTIYAISSGTGTGSGSGNDPSSSGGKKGDSGNVPSATISKVRLDRNTITRAMKKRLMIEELRGVIDTSGVNKKRANSVVLVGDSTLDNGIDGDVGGGKGGGVDGDAGRGGRKKKRKKNKRNVRDDVGVDVNLNIDGVNSIHGDQDEVMEKVDDTNDNDEMGVDESLIFGQTTGQSNATWVECDKCKKVRI